MPEAATAAQAPRPRIAAGVQAARRRAVYFPRRLGNLPPAALQPGIQAARRTAGDGDANIEKIFAGFIVEFLVEFFVEFFIQSFIEPVIKFIIKRPASARPRSRLSSKNPSPGMPAVGLSPPPLPHQGSCENCSCSHPKTAARCACSCRITATSRRGVPGPAGPRDERTLPLRTSRGGWCPRMIFFQSLLLAEFQIRASAL